MPEKLSGESKLTSRTLIGVIALLLISAGLGFGLHRWSSPETTVLRTLPDFVLKDSNNEPRSIREWAGKSLIVNFWATWCEPCMREMPLLKKLQTDRASSNFQIVGIAVDRREDVLAYMQGAGMNYPVLIGEQEAIDAAAKLGVKTLGLPFTVFTDNQGRIVTLKLGELSANKTDKILDAIQSVNAGQLTFEQAQAVAR